MGNDLLQFDFFSLLPSPWTLHVYGLLIAVGFLCGVQLSKEQAAREGLDGERMVDTTFYVLLSGLAGGRVVYMLTDWRRYFEHPLDMFKIWEGGLVFYGGLFGALAYLVYHRRQSGIPIVQTLDILIAPTALGHAFGRLGCLAAGCCFGQPTTLPWGIVFPLYSFAHTEQVAQRLVAANHLPLPVHPTQLYESSAELLLFFLLTWWRPNKRFHGQVFLLWLGTYPLVRTAIECCRGDSLRGVYEGFSLAQILSLGVALAAAALAVLWRPKKAVV